MTSDLVSGVPDLPDRYEAVAEIGRGGMGVVWQVRDRSLERQLAVKIMLPRAAAKVDNQTRFIQEAQITGGLQHPGIPPVVECGELSNKLPFFSMKLVAGRTLGELLHERRDVSVAVPHLLGIFEQVCQAVGYAHSRGIIHRDLKPANVMVGAFGEVQVMDWGMAKRIWNPGSSAQAEPRATPLAAEDDTRPRSESTKNAVPPTINWENQEAEAKDAPSTEIQEESVDGATEYGRPASASDTPVPTHTQAGTVMGTIAYMPPEQARGQVERLDARSDVFSLGAVLYEILTGQRLYEGKDVRKQAAAGDLGAAFERLRSCTADKELIELCSQCLAVDLVDRPADGSVVAETLRRYDEGVKQRLQEEQVERAAADARSEEQQKRVQVERAKRRIALSLAGAVMILTIIVGAGAWWYSQDQIAKRTAAAMRAERAAEDVESGMVRAAQMRDDHRFNAAAALLTQAERRLPELSDSTALADNVRKSSAELQMVRQLDEIRIRKATWTNDGFDKQFSKGPDGAYATTFREYGIDVLGSDAAESVGERIIESSVAASLIAALDDWASEDADHAKRILEVARAADDDPLRDQIRDPEVWGDRAKLLDLAESADLDQLAPSTLSSLAYRLASVGDAKAAGDILQRGAMQHPADFWLRFQSAEVLEGFLDRPAEAVGHLQAAIAIRPDNAAAYSQLGFVLKEVGRMDEAKNALHRAIDVDPKHAKAHCNLGGMLYEADELQKAIARYQLAVEADPNYSLARSNLGVLLSEAGRTKEAEDAYRLAILIDPQNAMGQSNLGLLLHETGRLKEAEAAHRLAIAADKNYANGHYNLALLLQETATLEEAEAAYRTAIKVDPTFPEAHCNLGNLLFNKTDRFEEAVELLKRGHALGNAKRKWPYPSDQWLANAERGLAMDQQLSAIRSGAPIPEDTKQRLLLAELALTRKRHPRIANKLYQAGLGDASLPPQIQWRFQYNAACAALLSAEGKVEPDAEAPDVDEAASLRKQAHERLSANLATWKRLMEGNAEAREAGLEAIQHWLVDSDLASVRVPERLAKLAENERADWDALWRDVKQTLEPVPDGNTKP